MNTVVIMSTVVCFAIFYKICIIGDCCKSVSKYFEKRADRQLSKEIMRDRNDKMSIWIRKGIAVGKIVDKIVPQMEGIVLNT